MGIKGQRVKESKGQRVKESKSQKEAYPNPSLREKGGGKQGRGAPRGKGRGSRPDERTSPSHRVTESATSVIGF